MESDLAAIDELARSGGAELVLVSVPQRGPWDDSHRYPGRRLAAWSERRGVPFVDALPHLERAAPGPPLYWVRDGHCTPQGYAVIARAVADFLVERRLVP